MFDNVVVPLEFGSQVSRANHFVFEVPTHLFAQLSMLLASVILMSLVLLNPVMSVLGELFGLGDDDSALREVEDLPYFYNCLHLNAVDDWIRDEK